MWAMGAVDLVRIDLMHFLATCRNIVNLVLLGLVLWVSCVHLLGVVCLVC